MIIYLFYFTQRLTRGSYNSMVVVWVEKKKRFSNVSKNEEERMAHSLLNNVYIAVMMVRFIA